MNSITQQKLSKEYVTDLAAEPAQCRVT